METYTYIRYKAQVVIRVKGRVEDVDSVLENTFVSSNHEITREDVEYYVETEEVT